MKLHEAIFGTLRILAMAGAVGLAYSEFGGTAAVILWLTTMAVMR